MDADVEKLDGCERIVVDPGSLLVIRYPDNANVEATQALWENVNDACNSVSPPISFVFLPNSCRLQVVSQTDLSEAQAFNDVIPDVRSQFRPAPDDERRLADAHCQILPWKKDGSSV